MTAAKDTKTSEKSKPKLDFRNTIVEIRTGISFEEILQEQHYKTISYQEFRTMADVIEWEHSLEELLAALD